MVLKKITSSYHTRLFIPLVSMLWLLLGIVFVWQYEREREYRTSSLKTHLGFINSRFIHAYERDTKRDINIVSFIDFLGSYYHANPVFNDLRISVYDAENKKLVNHVGEPIPYKESDRYGKQKSTDEIVIDPEEVGIIGDEEFYYAVNHSRDNKYVIYTAMAYGDSISERLLNDYGMWLILIGIGLLFTFLAYVSTRYISRTVKLLRNFADRAETDPMFVPVQSEFPHDELGEIAQTIINLYHARTEANERMEYEHRVAIHSIEEKQRVKRELTNNINHEFKTPLAIIRGYLDTVLADPDMDPEARTNFLTKALANVQRLCTLMEEVSTITRLDEKGVTIATECIDFHDVVYAVATEVQDSGVAGKMQIRYNIPFGCNIQGNQALLMSMLMNLIKNAVAYSHGTQCCIEMVDERPGEYVFQVYDNGVGVDENHLPHLFERFYRVDTGRTRKAGGTGLGLSIVYNCVKVHGGTIVVSNRTQGGLVFRFTLPKCAERKPAKTDEKE